jgi:hypothetical protein
VPDAEIEPDTKDWTWVLDRPCPECGYDASAVSRAHVPARLRASADPWPQVLAGPGATVRPSRQVWSPLEYACHVRDVHRVFAGRLDRMLAEDDPVFGNWDQDEAATRGAYLDQDPATVAADLTRAAAEVAAAYDRVREEQWDRPGRRSDGSLFTVDTLARYHLHDVEHHLVDVRSDGSAT